MPVGVYKHHPNQGFQKGNKLRFGYKHSEATKRKIGDSNKLALKGNVLSAETKELLSIARKKEWKEGRRNANHMFGERNHGWKGDNVGYDALHDWVKRKLGKPQFCSYCNNKSLNSRSYHWANISRHYKRDLEDWIRLCVSCHKLYDLGKLKLNI